MNETVTQLKKLISFKTVTGNRTEVIKAFHYLESLMGNPAIAFHYFEKGGHISQIAYLKGTNWKKPEIILNGHIDVIPAEADAFTPKQKGDVLVGRGGADMKGGVLAIVSAMQVYAQNPGKRNVIALITSDEETGGVSGVGALAEELSKTAEFIIVGDGPRYDKMLITNREKGGLWVEIVTGGKSAHAARPWLGENAIEKVLRSISVIKDHVGEIKKEAWKSTYNVALIETSNKTPNVVPATARAVVDIRFTPDLAKTPRQLLAALQKKIPFATLRALTDVALLETKPSNEWIQKFQKGARRATGGNLPLGFGHAASDGRYFAARGIPTILIGPMGGNWHGKDEWVSIKSVEKLRAIFAAAILELSQ